MKELLLSGVLWGSTNNFIGDNKDYGDVEKNVIDTPVPVFQNILLFRHPIVAIAYGLNQCGTVRRGVGQSRIVVTAILNHLHYSPLSLVAHFQQRAPDLQS